MLRAKHEPHVSKALRKVITKRSCLENVYFKKHDNRSLTATKSKINILVGYIKKINSNPKFVSDTELFWETVKHLFSVKGRYNANVKPTDLKNEIVQKWRKSCRNNKKCCY